MLILSSGADFDDDEYGVKEEDKDSRKVLSRLQYSNIHINQLLLRLKTKLFSEAWLRTAKVFMER